VVSCISGNDISKGVENKRTYELDEQELILIREEVEKYQVEGDLRQKVQADIQRLKDINCYRGRRHSMVRQFCADWLRQQWIRDCLVVDRRLRLTPGLAKGREAEILV